MSGKNIETDRVFFIRGVDQHDITIGASVGIARAREDDEDWRQVIERADDMLYRAKEAGRGRAQGADAGNDASSDPPLR